MGVDNLLAFVKPATTQTHVQDIDFRNSRAAVDISHWIYKASYACPEALYHRTNVNTAYNTITNYIDNYIQLMKFYNVKLTFVFDGMKLPAKKVTHLERSQRKMEAKRMVERFLKSDNKQEARKFMLRCLDVKFDVVQQVIKYCKDKKISYIIAPYEADAQIAYFNNEKLIDFVITEDTDLILYGCEKIIYKLDATGSCLLYERSKLFKCLGAHSDKVDFEKFRRICILSGCDYLKNIPSVGLQSAKKFFLLTQQDNLRILLPKLGSYLKSPRLIGKVTEEYVNAFIEAESTFRHHIVYDVEAKRLRPLEPYEKGKSSRDFPAAGKMFCPTQAQDFVSGKIDLDELDPDADLDTYDDSESYDDDDDEAKERGGDEDKQAISDQVPCAV